MYDLRGKKVLVVGLGLFGGGVGAVRFFVRKGAQVTVTDLKPEEELRESLDALSGLPVRFVLGGHEVEDFVSSDIVVPGPAVPPDSPYLKAAEDSGVPVIWRDNLIFLLCRSPIVGVTGSNGKSTTTALLGEVLRMKDPRVLVGGNLGGSLLDEIESLPEDAPLVLELSSFQLEALAQICRSPQVAVVLNLSPNHIDRHKTFEAYMEAKRNIVRFQGPEGLVVLNRDDPLVWGWREEARGRVVGFSACREVDGVFLRGEEILADGRFLFERDDLHLPGLHNLYNAMAASAAALALGVEPEVVREAVRKFRGLPHRLEFVREVRGVRYYDDSKATTPEATVAALRTFEENVVLIAGGYDKGLPLGKLADEVSSRAKLVLLLGETGLKLAELVRGPRVEICSSLEEALKEASSSAVPGDVVLLSPAAASYDTFRNYEERGDKFKELVMEL